jgi:hypothetical protein
MIVAGNMIMQQLGTTNHSTKHIVKIMRNPASQLADSIHFLALRQLGLHFIFFGHIPEHENHTNNLV